jgi:hypothetical protein
VIEVGAAGAVPLALVDADHAAGVASDAVVGEEVGRVGEDEVDRFFRELLQQVQAIALVDGDVVLGVAEDGCGQRLGGLLAGRDSLPAFALGFLLHSWL